MNVKIRTHEPVAPIHDIPQALQHIIYHTVREVFLAIRRPTCDGEGATGIIPIAHIRIVAAEKDVVSALIVILDVAADSDLGG